MKINNYKVSSFVKRSATGHQVSGCINGKPVISINASSLSIDERNRLAKNISRAIYNTIKEVAK